MQLDRTTLFEFLKQQHNKPLAGLLVAIADTVKIIAAMRVNVIFTRLCALLLSSDLTSCDMCALSLLCVFPRQYSEEYSGATVVFQKKNVAVPNAILYSAVGRYRLGAVSQDGFSHGRRCC